MPSMNFEDQAKMQQQVQYAVQQLQADGNMHWTYEIKQLTKEGAQNGNSTSFNSNQPLDSTSLSSLLLNAVVNYKVRFDVSPYGQVSALQHPDTFWNRLPLTLFAQMPDGEIMYTMLKKTFYEQMFAEVPVQLFAAYTDQKIRRGKKWSERQLLSVYRVPITHTYKLTKVSNASFFVLITTNCSETQNNDYHFGPMNSKVTLSGNGSGQLEIDRRTGIVKHYQTTSNYNGTMTVSVPFGSPMTVPIEYQIMEEHRLLN
jgi:hypothetical protein